VGRRDFQFEKFIKLKCKVTMKKQVLSKIILSVMKFSAVQICLIAFFSSVVMAHNYGQDVLNTRVSINLDNTELKSFLSFVENTAKVKFTYSNQKVSVKSRISINANNERLEELLNRTLKPLNIGYEVFDRQIVLNKLAANTPLSISPKISSGLEKTEDKKGEILAPPVNGKIKDAKTDEPIVGANVVIKGTQKGATTDINGNFTLEANAGDVLVVTYVGYVSKEFKIAGDGAIVIGLEESPALLGETVVIGSRGKPRTDVERPVPVDVLTAKELQSTGQVELTQQVQYMSPSFNSAKNGINGIANYADPASLKGLSPDQMLVLIEGKRYHQFAAIQTNVTVGKGTVVTDLNGVPSLALERLEILRDGAAAQYGSDAIAGIANLVLKKTTGKGTAQIQYGGTSKGDGGGYTAGLNYGFALGAKGFLNLTGSYQDVTGTDRSDVYNPQPVAGGTYTGIYTNVAATDQAALLSRKYWGDGTYGSFHTAKYGSNPMKSGQAFYNAGGELGNNWSIYSFGSYSNKKVFAGAFLRTALPTSATSNVDLYPDGYVPQLPGTSIDYSTVVGFKRTVATGWNMDFSTGYGKNTLDQYAKGSSNASLGAASPKDFYAGRIGFGQSLTEANISKNIKDFSGTKALNIALGAQYRVDNFELTAGDAAASEIGPLAATKNKTPGSQGRVGIGKEDERTRKRSNVGVYADIESDITDRFLVAAALRYENYSDFGGNISGKLASRLKLTNNFSIRGSINKGFRAPLLQQIASAATTSTVQVGVLSSTKQLPSDEPKLKQLGIEDPKPETSLNYNLGVTAKAGNNFLFTVDAYQIDIKDRIIITENFNTKDIAALKTLFAGVQQVTFFTNAISTQTKGVDLVASYKNQINEKSRFTSSVALTVNKTHISGVIATPAALQAGTTAPVLLIDTVSRGLIETSQPHTKVLVSLGYQYNKLSLNLRSSYFGEVTAWEKPTGLPHRAQTFAGKNVFDVSLTYNITKLIGLTVGGNNVTDVYPDKVYSSYASYTNGQVPYTRNANQFGFNGAYYYGTVTVNF
jgi:iron complex outermembrane recepter protein